MMDYYDVEAKFNSRVYLNTSKLLFTILNIMTSKWASDRTIPPLIWGSHMIPEAILFQFLDHTKKRERDCLNDRLCA